MQSDDQAINVRTKVNQNDITVDMEYPLTVTITDSSYSLSEFSAKFDSKFNDIYELAGAISDMTLKDPEWIDIEFISQQPYKIRLIKTSATTLLYEIRDDAGLENQEFIYRFAMKYDV